MSKKDIWAWVIAVGGIGIELAIGGDEIIELIERWCGE